MQHDFPKIREGRGQRLFGTFPNSSVLVASPVPKMAERNHLVEVDGDDHGSEFDHEWRLSHLELV